MIKILTGTTRQGAHWVRAELEGLHPLQNTLQSLSMPCVESDPLKALEVLHETAMKLRHLAEGLEADIGQELERRVGGAPAGGSTR